jgi:ADP-ribose pyrophosphatase YjhB (NUDIX family)
MRQGYKIYYNDRVVVLTPKVSKSIEKDDGLFYKYQSKEEFFELLNAFESFAHINTLNIFYDRLDELLGLVKSSYTVVEAAGGLVQNKEGAILAIFRRGKWDLPKGKVEKGEFYTQTALREVQEECGLKQIEIGKHLMDTFHIYTENGIKIFKRTVWYNMLLTDDVMPVPQTSEDITEVKWFDYNTIGEVIKNTYASLKDIFTNAWTENTASL